MSVPTEELGIKNFITERIVAEWVDDTGKASALGSCLLVSQQKPDFFLRVGSDLHGQIHIHLSLMVTVKAAGRRREREILLVVPTNALHKDIDFKRASKPLETLGLRDLTSLDPSTLHEAGISDSERIIRVHFNLITNGFVVMKETTSETIKPTTSTARELILGFESLSRALDFYVYIRPSSYARRGLEQLQELLSTNDISSHHFDMVEMYIQEGAMLMNWNKFEYSNGQDLLLPPYPEPTKPPAVVQAPQSPPNTVRKKPLLYSTEVRVAETRTGTPVRDNNISPSPTSVLHNIFSDIEENLADIDRFLEGTVDSGEEYDSILRAQEPSQPQDSSVSEALLSEIFKWMHGAVMINRDIHKHWRLGSKLSTLGHYARVSNAKAFYATKLWCSTLLFYDPADSDSASGLWDPANRWLVLDIVDLVRWANKLHPCAEMYSPDVRREFVGLGDVARSIARHRGRDKDGQYEHQRSVCITRVLFEFGKAGESLAPKAKRGRSPLGNSDSDTGTVGRRVRPSLPLV